MHPVQRFDSIEIRPFAQIAMMLCQREISDVVGAGMPRDVV
jgi:hypothetical protein